MFEKIYKNSIIEKPKLTLSILIILLLSFGYFSKDFQLDASSDTLLLENDPYLKYLRECKKNDISYNISIGGEINVKSFDICDLENL